MENSFFSSKLDPGLISKRLFDLENARIGFYSIGLYPASLAYNCAMQKGGTNLLLAPRPGREIMGAFDIKSLKGMDETHLASIDLMSKHLEGGQYVYNSLSDLILRCELVILSANSNHIEIDLIEACSLREKLNRSNVVLACLAGSFCKDENTDNAYILCEKFPNLAFFTGFHRHDSLRNPLDSFTANFCHPNSLIALIGSRMLNKLSPNIQVSAGVHNIEGQYIKAAKNMSSIFAGFGYTFHKSNPGLLPTLLTLLLEQCLDQAATVSMSRLDRDYLYHNQPIPLTELGYGVQRIEASLIREGNYHQVRDHTFTQLTAMVADARGSMMMPVKGKPTRNFQAGQVLAYFMLDKKRCPECLDEFILYCEQNGLKRGGLEGIKSLEYLPKILKNYSIPIHDSSMLNLLYIAFYSDPELKSEAYEILTQSRLLTKYCQESVRPIHSRRFEEALNNLNDPSSVEMFVNSIMLNTIFQENRSSEHNIIPKPDYHQDLHLMVMRRIDLLFKNI